ncbi:MAG: glycoside hydrolase family 20 zincin-like fold domain-containing protein [Petrimonas sp.]|nr:glycoside hydrolase family 20 zincin-like fold domain-containing protein [Petrimonas sp.]
MDYSRRDFVKKISAGVTGVFLGNLSFDSEVYGNDAFLNHKKIVDNHSLTNSQFSPIFPIPREFQYYNNYFNLNEKTVVLVPYVSSEQDKFLSQFLVSELAERYGLVLKIKKATSIAGFENYILIGSVENPLVKNYASLNNIPVTDNNPGPEGYFLQVTKTGIGILGSDDKGAFYGLQSLRQLVDLHDAEKIKCADIKDWPYMPFRGIRLNIPGATNIEFYRRFLRDFMAYFKYNKVIMEVDAVMRLEKHPELNAGWIELFNDMNYSRRRQSIDGPNGENGNSVHQDAGDGGILEKSQVSDIVEYGKKHFIETIPEIPSLPHSSYLLTRHRELSENINSQWPDTYCPSNPKVYELYFDVLDEYIEVMKPNIINIGHDEWRVPLHECEKCKGKNYIDLYIQDVQKIHKYLKDKNIRTAMWGDHLMERVRGKGEQTKKLSSGYSYQMPGGIPPETVKTRIPKDILILNWFWKIFKTTGEQNTEDLAEWGFEQIYGNFEPYINDFARRSKVKGVLGGAPSAWSGTNEYNFGKNKLYKFLGCANLLWSTHYQDEFSLARYIQHLMPIVRIKLKGLNPPSKEGETIPIDISASFNISKNNNSEGIPFGILKEGNINLNQINFKLHDTLKNNGLCAIAVSNIGKTKNHLPTISKKISINEDVSGLIFLHCCAHPSTNIYSHYKIHSYEDTSDLLGWYKIIYDDGFIESVPIRYAENIKEWHTWDINPLTGSIDDCLVEPYCNGIGSYCYEGDILNCSSDQDKELNFFSYEWKNSRFGAKIREIYLEGSQQFIRYDGEVINSNAIYLIALSYVSKRNINEFFAK